jgi:predicted ATP-grasp superfamily ATP-dependent carboligase
MPRLLGLNARPEREAKCRIVEGVLVGRAPARRGAPFRRLRFYRKVARGEVEQRNMADGRAPLRILLSEGSSTSAREAITALGLNGHYIEVCDPDAHCLGRFSKFVRRFHRCPGLRDDPAGYLDFVLDLLTRRRFDVLLPIHEQGFLFARVRERLAPLVAVALPSFASYARAHGKVPFSTLLTELGLPQPATRLAASLAELRALAAPPCVVKASTGTASRGTWIVRSGSELTRACEELSASDAFAEPVLIQEFVPGSLEHAQAVFAHGALIAVHGYQQEMAGAGGGPAAKCSIARPVVREHLARIGARLAWHGALSVDYILHPDTGEPAYIACNPRLVEPMSAYFAGLDLAELLVQVSRNGTGQDVARLAGTGGRAGVRTHIAMQALLGLAARGASRRELLAECRSQWGGKGIYAGSREELTPVRLDWLSALPLAATAVLLLARPSLGRVLPRRGFGAHLLSPRSIRVIEERFA